MFTNGKSGTERFILHSGQKVTLDLVGLARGAQPHVDSSVANLLTIGAARKRSDGWSIPFSATGTGTATVSGTDGAKNVTSFEMIVGSVQNHPGMDIDLIADVFRGHDNARKLALIRLLGNEVANVVNENSQEALQQWGPLACGTMSKVAGQKLFWSALNYDKHDGSYYKPIAATTVTTRGHTEKIFQVAKREDVTYNDKTLEKGRTAIKAHLKAGHPVITGVTYAPSLAVQRGGSLNVTGAGGHTVLIVACSDDAKTFLYLDPFGPDENATTGLAGSALQYQGGPKGANAFPDTCKYLGLFETVVDANRGCSVLRQAQATQAKGGTFAGDQFLEVIAGPLH